MSDVFGSRKSSGKPDGFTLSRVRDLVSEDLTVFDVGNSVDPDHPILLEEVGLTLIVQPVIPESDELASIAVAAFDEVSGSNPIGLVAGHDWGSALVQFSVSEISAEDGAPVGEPLVVFESSAERVADWAEWLLRSMRVRGVRGFDNAVQS